MAVPMLRSISALYCRACHIVNTLVNGPGETPHQPSPEADPFHTAAMDTAHTTGVTPSPRRTRRTC
jgi:hypothetical protein